jgi:hypothetical protein
MADYADLLAVEENKKPEQIPSSSGAVSADKKPQIAVQKTTRQTKEVRRDVMTAQHHNVDYRSWHDIIENTETHNSALRLTREERYQIEDMIQDLERTHKIKTSMNEVARLGLLVIADYKKNKRDALIYKIKKS